MPLKVVPRKNTETLYIRGTVNGREVFVSARTTSKRVAEKRAAELTAELMGEPEHESPLFIEAATSYVTAGGEIRFLSYLEPLYPIPLADIAQDTLDRIARCVFPTQKASTLVRQFYTPALSILHHAAERGLCPYKKFQKPKVKRPPPKWAEQEWFDAIIPHCSVQLAVLLVFLPYTGCRISEALALTWGRVSLKDRWCYIPDTKNGTPRTVSLPDIVIEELRKIMPEKYEGRVFRFWKDHRAANWAIRRTVARVNKERVQNDLPEIPYLSTHQIGSHTYATWMRREVGMDHVGLVATGRWKHPQSTFIYTHTVASEESRKSDLLPQIRAKSVQSPRKPQKT